MDDLEIRRVVLKRNALRRESGLPLLDIEKEVRNAHGLSDSKAAREHHERLRKLYADHYTIIRDEITAEARASGNATFPMGRSGRYYLRVAVERRFREFLERVDSYETNPIE